MRGNLGGAPGTPKGGGGNDVMGGGLPPHIKALRGEGRRDSSRAHRTDPTGGGVFGGSMGFGGGGGGGRSTVGLRVVGGGCESKRGMEVGLWWSIGREGALRGHERTGGGTHRYRGGVRGGVGSPLNPPITIPSPGPPRPAAMSEAEEEYEE